MTHQEMRDITECVICGKHLSPERKHVDTCSERCFRRQLAEQRRNPRGRPSSSELTFESPDDVVKEGERIERAKYWADVKSLAKQVFEEADGDEDEIEEILHETVDGSHYVIYYRENLTVLRFTENDDEWKDLGMDLGDNPVMTIAFFALRADIRDEIDRLEPEEDDDED